MKKTIFKMSKSKLFLFTALLVIAIFVPLTAYALTTLSGGDLHDSSNYTDNSGNILSNHCSICKDISGSIADTGNANDQTINGIVFDFSGSTATITVPPGIDVDYIAVKAGNAHVLYTITGGSETVYQVSTADKLDSKDISHIVVWYTGTPEDPKISITGTKIWLADPGTEYSDIKLYLYNDVDTEHVDSHTLEAEDYTGLDTWQYTFTGLPATDGQGHTYVYRIEEVNVPDGYVMSISSDGLTITNTQKGRETIDIPVTKVWRGRNPGPDVTVDVYLVIDDEVQTRDKITLSADNDWTGMFKGLEPGLNYSVVEDADDIPGRFTSSVSGDAENGFTITNRYHEPPDEDEEEEEEDEIPEPEVPLDELPEPEVPLDETPETGDNMNGTLFLILAASSLIALSAMRYLSRSES